jgi:predicted metal-dependent phosphoesterase TrpH
MDARELMRVVKHHDAVAIPAHPGRSGIGLINYIDQGEVFEDVQIVELLNGGSRQGENERAAQLLKEYGYLGTGGSDAHLTSHIGFCLTKFEAAIKTERDLVEALLSGRFEPLWLEVSHDGSSEQTEAANSSNP